MYRALSIHASMLQECLKAIAAAGREFAGINIYDVYVDVCLPKRAMAPAQQLAQAAMGHPAALGPFMALSSAPPGICWLVSLCICI